MKLISLSTFVIIFSLTGCLPNSENNNSDNLKFNDQEYSYELEVKADDFIGDWSPRTTGKGETAHSLWNGHLDDGKDMFLDVYHLTKNCSSETLGTQDINQISNTAEKMSWAKVPVVNVYDRSAEAVCDIIAPECTDEELFDGSCQTKAATYAFCSKKEDKTVFICISQMTDNPQLAEDIFKTFRWTE